MGACKHTLCEAYYEKGEIEQHLEIDQMENR